MVVASLESSGYEVLGAETPAAALQLSKDYEGKIDMLLSDVVMPGMDGTRLAAALAEERPGLKVLYVSGYSRDHISDRGVLAQGVNFMQKPYRPSELAAEVRRILGD